MVLSRKFDFFVASPSTNVKENNGKILKFLNFDLRFINQKINQMIIKIKEFLDDLSIKEATEYLIKVFSEFVG